MQFFIYYFMCTCNRYKIVCKVTYLFSDRFSFSKLYTKTKMASIDSTLETLAPSKLLNYVQKDRLIDQRDTPTTSSTTEQIQRQSERHEAAAGNAPGIHAISPTTRHWKGSIRQVYIQNVVWLANSVALVPEDGITESMTHRC
jgi:hypothetical protein